jgi:hypothetical protein
MLKSAARVLGLLPYRLRAEHSSARPSGPGSPKERSGQTDDMWGNMLAITSIGQKPDIGQGPLSKGQGQGHTQAECGQSERDRRTSPLKYNPKQD